MCYSNCRSTSGEGDDYWGASPIINKPWEKTEHQTTNGDTYDSPDSARSSALSKSASTMANLRATCDRQTGISLMGSPGLLRGIYSVEVVAHNKILPRWVFIIIIIDCHGDKRHGQPSTEVNPHQHVQ